VDSVSGIGVLDKAFAIVDALEAGPRSLNDLVATTGIARATTHRLAVAMEAHGMVRRDDEGRFALGLRLLPLADLARPALERLRDETGESVQLYVAQNGARVCVLALDSPHGLRTIVRLGESLPLDRGSAGRVLSGQPVGARGWIESVEEREAGVASVSAPVFDAHGGVIAAVSVSGPVQRTTRTPGKKYGAACVSAARAVEAPTRPARR
jgi:DNA-binding IclR family transcriptional regulator